MLQRSEAEKNKAGDEAGVRLPMVPDTPFAAGVVRGAFRLSELARDESEVLEVATPSAITGGARISPAQVEAFVKQKRTQLRGLCYHPSEIPRWLMRKQPTEEATVRG